MCYGGVIIIPKIIRGPVTTNPKSVLSPVGQRQLSNSRKYYKDSQPKKGDNPKQSSNSKCTSTRNNSNGAIQFPFKGILNFPTRNIPLTQLKLKDRLTQLLGFDRSQKSSLIRHPDKPQGNVRAQNNIRAQMYAQRTMIHSGRKFSQMQARGMHSQAGGSRNQRNSGNQKNRSSSTASAAAGFGAGMAFGGCGGNGGGKGGGNGSDDDDSDDGSTKYVPWLRGQWRNSREGSYMQNVPVYSHIMCRNIGYLETRLDGRSMWISLNPSGYKFDAWRGERLGSDQVKLYHAFYFNANGKKEGNKSE